MVVGKALDVVLERVHACGRDDPRLAHRAAEEVLQAPRRPHPLLGACDERAEGAAEPLREAEGDGVRRPRQVGGRDAERDRRVQEARAVDVEEEAEFAAGLRHLLDRMGPPDASARAVVRVLDRDDPGDGPVHLGRIPGGRTDGVRVEAPGEGRQRPHREPRVHGRPTELAEEEVRMRIGEQLVAGPAEQPQRDLVRHRRGR